MPIPALSNSQLQASHGRQPLVGQARNAGKNKPTPSSLGLSGSGDGKNRNLRKKLRLSFSEQGY